MTGTDYLNTWFIDQKRAFRLAFTLVVQALITGDVKRSR